ncbi:MAG TPA: YebC/PmpR family DNA-binding transcriptional regulator [Cytophagaceae bacterium]|jgi:YebC/PmpR family DNA-binding regulatory protein|nr:YebC/PmpR family DNA-binding transcriptional regulator [Cytophagaceae bacterium]
MGRIFEKRKHTMFARYDKMAKAFTRIGKEIVIAVKANGPLPENNPRLRVIIQNAKGLNMPKDRVEAAIKRASSKDEKDLEEIVYEGYGPYGVAIVLEAATDNINRTVANIRTIFSRGDGALGKTGSLDFIFTRKGVFKFMKEGLDIDSLELELIDFGAEDVAISEEGEVYIYTSFQDFGSMQKALEDKKINVISADVQRIPTTFVENLTSEQEEEILQLVEKFEEDDDIQAVYHNMK